MAAEDYIDFDWAPDPDPVTCNRCGKRNLDWHHTGVRWRLMEQDGKLHDCLSKPASPDEFEVLP